ncbi:MAG: maleylacetoacetate isomerase [Ostreibacterium sp.]
MNNKILYGYWRSSASYRVRIALNLKKLDYTHQGIHLVKKEQQNDGYLKLNPQGLIPLYIEETTAGRFILSQSLAIMDYLEQAYPNTLLLPTNLSQSAKIKSLAQIVVCDIHPLDNLRVLQYLENQLRVSTNTKMAWYHHWIIEGFTALEKQLNQVLGENTFSMGEVPGYLEAAIIPQVYNAKRFNCSLEKFPQIIALDNACQHYPAFIKALPENQPDAEKNT